MIYSEINTLASEGASFSSDVVDSADYVPKLSDVVDSADFVPKLSNVERGQCLDG